MSSRQLYQECHCTILSQICCLHCNLLVNITVRQREELNEALQGVPRDGAGLLRVEDEPEDADVVAEGGPEERRRRVASIRRKKLSLPIPPRPSLRTSPNTWVTREQL